MNLRKSLRMNLLDLVTEHSDRVAAALKRARRCLDPKDDMSGNAEYELRKAKDQALKVVAVIEMLGHEMENFPSELEADAAE